MVNYASIWTGGEGEGEEGTGCDVVPVGSSSSMGIPNIIGLL